MNVLHHTITGSKLLLATVALTIAGDWLLFGHGPGLGTALFFGLLWAALQWHRGATGDQWLLWALLLTSALQCVVEPGFSNSLVLVLLTAYASARWLHGALGARWRLATEGFVSLFRVPLTFASLKFSVDSAVRSAQTDLVRENASRAVTALRIIWPALLVAVPFLLLLGGGNVVLEKTFHNSLQWFTNGIRDIDPPSLGRLAFWGGLSFLLLGLFSQTPASKWLGLLEERLPERFRAPSDSNLAIWRTWLLLVVMNLIFFIANTTDAWFLWLNQSLPHDVTFSDFVHHGVYRLVACVLLAALVLGLIFHQSQKVVQASAVKGLAYGWIAQNLFLTLSVVLRLKMYVDAYQLTLLRLHVLTFLVLVATGFVLLGFKIRKDHGFAWLLNANLLAVFWLFFVMQFVNDRGLVAWVNYRTALSPARAGTVIDVNHLATLGAPAWLTLSRIANNPDKFPVAHVSARRRLAEALAAENRNETSWQSWQWRAWDARQTVQGWEVALAAGSEWKPVNE